MIPPNTSSDPAADTRDESVAATADSPGARALVRRLAREFDADAAALMQVASLFETARERAPDIFMPVSVALTVALSKVVNGVDAEPLYAALGEWALDAEGEPIEGMRRDCLRFQSAMTRAALRLYADDAERCTDSLLALQRYSFLQLALLGSLATRGQGEGSVVRTLPTPEYAAFMEIFRTAIEAHKQEGRQLGLLMLHVAKVEQVDRLLGLQKGEAFMLRVTRRMREGVLRKQDQLGRVSRDQFACLLPRIAGEGVAILAANKILDALAAPVPLGDRAFAVDASIGIALYPEHGTDQQTLVRNGKLAARVARGETERVATYDPAHGASEERSMLLETRLRHALEQGALALGFAPQFDAVSGGITGFDCGLRWTDPELGEVTEMRAVEAAEAAGIIHELTWWIYNNALRSCGELAKAGLTLPVSVKATTSALAQSDFSEFLSRALKTWKVVPEMLVIEIGESALAGDMEPLRETLGQLKALGVRLAIGGFGTASFSLANLAQLPLDDAKIGAAFASDMTRMPMHEKIVRSLVHLANDLGLGIIADGVADAATAAMLMKLGCTRIQGPYVGRALSTHEILRCGLRAAKLVELPLSPCD